MAAQKFNAIVICTYPDRSIYKAMKYRNITRSGEAKFVKFIQEKFDASHINFYKKDTKIFSHRIILK